MLKKIIYGLIITVIFFLISSELMMSTLVEGYGTQGDKFILILLPGLFLFTVAALLTYWVTIPRFLLRGRFIAFIAFTLLLSYIVLFSFLFIENAGARWAGIPSRVADFSTPWVYIERFTDAVTMSLILLGAGTYRLYLEWDKETRAEGEKARRLSGYISDVRRRLDSSRINHGLDEIQLAIASGKDEERVENAIDRLSDYLRGQLYEIPAPPEITPREEHQPSEKFMEFLSERKWHWLRVLLFQLAILISGGELFFKAPDTPGFKPVVLLIYFGFWAFINFLVWVNRHWLYRRFRCHLSPVRYLVEAAVFVVIPMFLFLVLLSSSTPGEGISKFEPVLIFFLSFFGSVLSLVLVEVGITAIFLMQYWVRQRRRTDSLVAETVRQEYLFLKKQINPHFLFNVLNNINILSYESREEALEMLRQLRELIDYQFEEATRLSTTPERELAFLRTYLQLEASRTDNLLFHISSDILAPDSHIPTLLFIPVVENAVKYSVGTSRTREIEIAMNVGDNQLMFACTNNIGHMKNKNKGVGGLGLTNLRRRLYLLYGEAKRYRFITSRSEDKFTVDIAIPLDLPSSSC